MESRYQLTRPAIALALLVLMAATRYHHFGSVLHLPDASWAIFLAAGFYLQRLPYLGLFLAAAGGIDYFAITQGGTDAYCVTAAYPFLIAAYGVLWFLGAWFHANHQLQWRALPALASTVVLGVTGCFVISNVAFYTYSGNFADMTPLEYASSVIRYYPDFLFVTASYIAVLALIHATVMGHSNAKAQSMET